MSFFTKKVTVPANTAKTEPYKTTISTQNGVLHRIYVYIPAGHAGLTGLRIKDGLHQIAPTEGSEWFTGDESEINYQEHFEINESPYNLTVEAYNEDETYDHAFIVGCGVLPEWVLMPQIVLQEILKSISDLLMTMSRFFGMVK